MIEFHNVGFKYDTGREVLNDISFMLAPGSYHFLSGASGSGKTSLMSLMYLGHRPTSGDITMFSITLSTLRREELFALRQRVGVVFQDFRLLSHLSAFDNVALPLRILGRPEHEINSHVNELLDWVGLGEHKYERPQTLSGGQQQRIAIARALVGEPKLILADEPTGALDSKTEAEILEIFLSLHRQGRTIIIVTHNEKVAQACQRRILLVDGQLEVATC